MSESIYQRVTRIQHEQNVSRQTALWVARAEERIEQARDREANP